MNPATHRLFSIVLAGLLAGVTSSLAQLSSNGLTLWLRADASVTRQSDGTVSEWLDQSPAGHHVSQSLASRRPHWITNALNALPALRFEGRQLKRSGVVASNLFAPDAVSVFLVLKPEEGRHHDTALSWAAANNQRLLVHAAFEDEIMLQVGIPPSGSIEVMQPPGWEGTWHVLHLQRQQQQGLIRVDGLRLTWEETFESRGATDRSADLIIGGDRFGNRFCGDLAEVIVYQRALSEAERTPVEDYLHAKYALPRSRRTIPLLVAPEVVTNAFRLTGASYTEKTNLEAVVPAELGGGAVLADWADLKHVILARRTTGPALCGALGLANSNSMFVGVEGRRYWEGPRQFAVTRFDKGPYRGFMVHDRIQNLYLGSWFDLNHRALGFFPDRKWTLLYGRTESSLGEQSALPEALQTEYGEHARLAEWADVKALIESGRTTAPGFCQAVGLADQTAVWISKDGVRFAEGGRAHYQAARFDQGPPKNWVVLDRLGNLYLGSAQGASQSALVYFSEKPARKRPEPEKVKT